MVSIRHQENTMILRTEAQRIAYRAQMTEALRQLAFAEIRKAAAISTMEQYIHDDSPLHTAAAKAQDTAYLEVTRRRNTLQALINNV